jgi:hypothetical protein
VDRLAQLRHGVAATAQTVKRAQHAAEVSTERAVEGYEHAAEGMERSAEAHERVADGLELRAEDAGEGREDLLRRAREHREHAERDRQEGATDGASAEKLRGRP